MATNRNSRPHRGLLATVLTAGLLVTLPLAAAENSPFGGEEDVSYSKTLWKALEKWNLVGPGRVTAVPNPGKSPHGDVLETVSTRITVDGHTGQVHVKTNYSGSDITPSKVANQRDKYLGPITVMFQREKGYDPDNQNWFWAKYSPDGALDKNPKGMSLAGRVAKGTGSGCIACHRAAQGSDYLFNNDPAQID